MFSISNSLCYCTKIGRDVVTTMEKINRLLKKNRIAGYRLVTDIGLTKGVYSQWNTGISQPSRDNLQKVADYFGVAYEDLLPDEEKEKTPAQPSEGLSGLDQELIRSILSLSDAEKASLYAFLSSRNKPE